MKKIVGFPKWLVDLFMHWPIFSLALWLSDSFFDSINFQNFESIFYSSLILTLLNLFIKPLVLLLTLPLTILSLGLIIPFLNGFFITIVASFVDGFYVESYIASVLVAIFISLLSILTQIAIGTTGASIFFQSRKKIFKDKNNDSDFSYKKTTTIDVEVKEKDK